MTESLCFHLDGPARVERRSDWFAEADALLGVVSERRTFFLMGSLALVSKVLDWQIETVERCGADFRIWPLSVLFRKSKGWA